MVAEPLWYRPVPFWGENTPQLGNAFREEVFFFAIGLLQGCCQPAPMGAAEGPVTAGLPSQGRRSASDAMAQHRCPLLSLLLTSGLFALHRAVLPMSQRLRWAKNAMEAFWVLLGWHPGQ